MSTTCTFITFAEKRKGGNIIICGLPTEDVISFGGSLIGYLCKLGHATINKQLSFNPCKKCNGIKGHQTGCSEHGTLTEYQEWIKSQQIAPTNTTDGQPVRNVDVIVQDGTCVDVPKKYQSNSTSPQSQESLASLAHSTSKASAGRTGKKRVRKAAR